MKEVKILRHLSTQEDDTLSSLYSGSSLCSKLAFCWAFSYLRRGTPCSNPLARNIKNLKEAHMLASNSA